MLSAAQALQWQQHQQQRLNQAQAYAKNTPQQQLMLAANSIMHSGHNSSTSNQNGNTVPSCNGCRELKREVDELKRLLGMDVKSDNSVPLYNSIANGQRPPFQLSQSLVTEPLFNPSPMPNLHHQLLLRLLANVQQTQQQQQQNSDQSQIWSQAVPTLAASTSGNVDLARNAILVESNVDNNNTVDLIGVDGSETSSSTSSANTQAMITHHASQQVQDQTSVRNGNGTIASNGVPNAITANAILYDSLQRALAGQNLFSQHHAAATLNSMFNVATPQPTHLNGSQQTPLPASMQLSIPSSVMPPNIGRPHSRHNGTHGGERNGVTSAISERRKASTDDFVKNIRQCQMTEDEVSKIEIPVPEALKYDQNFRPVPEEQIIQQIMTSKKYETMDVLETMIQLCKKLAEKRVFGSRLMADTTVAAPNHSNYTNLPDKGIIYILHVCQKVLGPRVKSEDQFWEYFRDAMRKLAARCRRVRHAKKMRSGHLHSSSGASSSALVLNNGPTMVVSPSMHSPSIFTSAQSLIAEDERLSRSSTEANPAMPSVASAVPTGRPFTPLSSATTITPTASNTSPDVPEGCECTSP